MNHIYNFGAPHTTVSSRSITTREWEAKIIAVTRTVLLKMPIANFWKAVMVFPSCVKVAKLCDRRGHNPAKKKFDTARLGEWLKTTENCAEWTLNRSSREHDVVGDLFSSGDLDALC